jgi:hypothetical protein
VGRLRNTEQRDIFLHPPSILKDTPVLDSRAQRIAWSFLVGIITLEGWAISASFRSKGSFLAALSHYMLAPGSTPLAWIIAGLVTILYAGYAATSSGIIRRYMLCLPRWGEYAALRLVAVPMALISGFFEEAFFRKFLMDWTMHSGHSVVLQIAFSACAFGAVHAVWGLMGGNLRAAAGAIMSTGLLGAALAVVYVLGGRSIAPCIAAHTAINLLLEPWLILTAAANGWRTTITPS